MTKTARSVFAAAAALGLLVLVIFSQPLYNDVDNYTVAMVVNGCFGKDNGCQYTHGWLNRLLSVLAGIFPTADVFTLVGRVLLTAAFALLLHRVGRENRIPLFSGMLLGFFLFLSVGISLFSGNYGVQCLFFTGTGLTLLLSDPGKKPSVPGCLFLAAGFLWRLQVSLLFLPFLCLEWICGKKWNIRENRLRIVVPLSLVLLLLAVQAFQEHREPLMSSLAYDRPRIRYQDYGAKDWPEVKEEAEKRGITHAEYEMVDQWLLLDTDVINAEKLQAIAEVSPKTDYPLTPEGFLEAARVLRWYFVGESVLNYVWLAAIVLGALALFAAADGCRRIQPLLVVLGGQLIIYIYLIIGRAPMRLIHSVYLVQSFALLWESLAIRDKIRGHKRTVVLVCFGALAAMFFGGSLLALKESGFHRPQMAMNARVGADDSALRVPDEEGIIIWDNWGQGFNRPLMKQGKLPTREMLMRHLPAGDWVYGQSYFQQFLRDLGLSNPYRALFNDPHRYYAVSGETSLALFAEHTPGFHAEPAGHISGIPVYRFTQTEAGDNGKK